LGGGSHVGFRRVAGWWRQFSILQFRGCIVAFEPCFCPFSRLAGEGGRRPDGGGVARRRFRLPLSRRRECRALRIKSFHCPFGPATYFLLLVQENSRQREGHPKSARQLRCRSLRCSESVGRRELGHPWPQTSAPFPAGFLRYSALPRDSITKPSDEGLVGAVTVSLRSNPPSIPPCQSCFFKTIF